VLRLWRSHHVVRDTNGNEPLWYGTLYRETFYRPAHLLTVATTHNVTGPSAIAALLAVQCQTVIRSATVDKVARYAVLVLPGACGASSVNIPEHK